MVDSIYLETVVFHEAWYEKSVWLNYRFDMSGWNKLQRRIIDRFVISKLMKQHLISRVKFIIQRTNMHYLWRKSNTITLIVLYPSIIN